MSVLLFYFSFLFKFTGQRKRDKAFRCWINVKMFGSDVSFLTCEDLHAFQRKLSLNTAGLVVKLLKVSKFYCFLSQIAKLQNLLKSCWTLSCIEVNICTCLLPYVLKYVYILPSCFITYFLGSRD